MKYSPATLVRAYRASRDGANILTGEWPNSVLSPEEYRAWFRRCLERKINHHDPRQVRGRKSSEEYAIELSRLRRYIGNRIVIDWIHPILGERVKAALAHRFREQYRKYPIDNNR